MIERKQTMRVPADQLTVAHLDGFCQDLVANTPVKVRTEGGGQRDGRMVVVFEADLSQHS